ncbi:MAG: alcohol dehydrogenase [Ramlibacter sp.]|uniref:c-type cytochrome n=1 Tax=Ramlibacter sp. TaxID=1917967 RepID=UPI002634D4A3|nr:cytochrome c [Ramlibacter sp.]MDB5752961.1 alcohol dehydrogenase [Ramlibacter sp.]
MKAQRIAIGVVGALLAAAACIAWLNVRGEAPLATSAATVPATPQTIERGAYLARAGNCVTCHTARGGAPFAGGKGIATPFGTIFAGNLTPDAGTGIGAWSSAEFWRALHHGRSRDGRLLYPAFPYPEYTRVTREDSDALYAFLRSQPAVAQANRPHDLRFPYDTQVALAVWRALFFSPGEFQPEPDKSAEWNRGAYLVRGVAHCQACHSPRNAFGATDDKLELSGGLIPMQNWYAPSLAAPSEAGVQDWSAQDVVQLLKTGDSRHGAALGPMADVVAGSTQHLAEADLHAMATFLRDLPRHDPPAPAPAPAPTETLELGARLYGNQCAQCHGEQGQGSGDIYPPLAGNRSVTMGSHANLVRVILGGGFAPTTPGNPRPFGMPPFGQSLNDAEIAAVASYVRSAWGNDAPAVQALDVQRAR